MSESYRKESRKDWVAAGGAAVPSIDQLTFGALQRIADATELMAKNHDGLVNERDQARKSRDYWMAEYDTLKRSNSALRGQITRLQAKLEKANAPQQ